MRSFVTSRTAVIVNPKKIKKKRKEIRMMKKRVFTGILVLSMVVTLGLGSNAWADGRAAAMLVGAEDMSVVALFDFNETQFTETETQDMAVLLQFGGSLLISLLAESAPDVTVNLTVFTPEQMRNFGLGDADVANSWILSHVASLGVDAYAKAVVTKVQPPQGVITGQNIRLDLYLFIPDPEAVDNEFLYLASVEIPLVFLQLFG